MSDPRPNPTNLRKYAKGDFSIRGGLMRRAADEIERLREDRDDHKRMREHWWREAGREIANKAAVQHRLNEAYKRIEELEAILRRLVERRMGDCFEFVIDDAKAVVGPLESNRHIITTNQIRAAWKAANSLPTYPMKLEGKRFETLAKLGIVRCKECRGTGDVGLNDCAVGCPNCAKWGSEGWVKE